MWKPVPFANYPYEVSNLGRVRRFSIASESTRRHLPNRNYAPHIVGHSINNGYHYITFSYKHQPIRVSLHCLVLEVFVGPRPDGMYGCHNDGNRDNNAISNLRWDTPKSNQLDRIKHGNDQYGEHNGSAKLTNIQADEILKIRSTTGMPYYKIAEKFGVSRATIHLICTGKLRARINPYSKPCQPKR